MTWPTTRAHLTCERSGRTPISSIENKIRRCTVLSPSRASGSAREEITEYAYSKKLVCISEETSMSTIRSVKSSSGGAVVLAIERRFSPLLCRYFSLAPVVPIAATTRCGTYGPQLEEGLEVIQQRIAGVDLAGVEHSVSESVLT